MIRILFLEPGTEASSLVSLLHSSLLRHIDAVQKLPDILVFNCCGLLNQSGWIWNKLYHSLQGLTHPSGLERQNKQHLSSSEPCGCSFHARNFGFQPKSHSPGWRRWWGSEHTQTTFCIGSPVWHPWSCSEHDCRWSWRWPVPFCYPTICQPRAFSFSSQEDSSTLMWLKSLRRVPLGPFTMTVRPFRVISTFSGMSTVWLLRMVFILAVDGAKAIS